MALLPTGSKELLNIETDKVSLSLKGALGSPKLSCISYTSTDSSVAVACRDKYDLNCAVATQLDAVQSGAGKQVYLCAPLCFEYTDYELVIEAKGDAKISFWHDNISLRNQVTPTGRSQRLWSGVVNFGSDLGFSDFVVRLDGKNYLRVRLEVFPSKLDYQKDYQAILADVTREIYNLAFDFLKKTYMSYKAEATDKTSPVEFLAILENIFKDYLKAADLIMARPHHILATETRVVPGHKLKRTSNRTVQWLSKHQQYVTSSLDVEKALEVHKYVTYDTKENRLTKYILQTTLKKLENFLRLYLNLNRQADAEFNNKLNWMQGQLKWRLKHTFLADVDAQAAGTGMSLVFSMAPGYRDLYKYHLLLLRGLTLTNDAFNISVKNLAELYEYWCFIKLNSILREKNEKYIPVSQDLVKFNGNGLFVVLVKGEQASRVVYETIDKQEQIILTYNETYKGKRTATVNQKPDNVLKLKKNGAQGVSCEYVFDAKYRLDSSEAYVAAYGTEGPPEDTINTMHRYRDAIVAKNDANTYERTMFGAYVLFPYADEEKFKNNAFSKEHSIKNVNVGAFPFLPSATKGVVSFLEELIAESPSQALNRAVEHVGVEQKMTEFWLRTEIHEWLQKGITDKKFNYGPWEIDMLEGVIKFSKDGNVVGVYASEYLKQKGVEEKVIRELLGKWVNALQLD